MSEKNLLDTLHIQRRIQPQTKRLYRVRKVECQLRARETTALLIRTHLAVNETKEHVHRFLFLFDKKIDGVGMVLNKGHLEG